MTFLSASKLLLLALPLFAFLSSPVSVSSWDQGLERAPRDKIKQGTSSNWSGYAVETNLTSPQSDVVTDVGGTWTVPTLTCTTDTTYSSAWVGIDGYDSKTVEQIGTEHDCKNGQASYYLWFEMYPKWGYRVNLPVSAGDLVSARVSFIGKGKYELSFTNNTTGQSFSTVQRSNQADRTSAEWVVEAPWSKGVLPLANFGTIEFTNAEVTIDGVTGNISNSSWQYDPITMARSDGTVKAVPSGLSSGGSSFSVTWQNN